MTLRGRRTVCDGVAVSSRKFRTLAAAPGHAKGLAKSLRVRTLVAAPNHGRGHLARFPPSLIEQLRRSNLTSQTSPVIRLRVAIMRNVGDGGFFTSRSPTAVSTTFSQRHGSSSQKGKQIRSMHKASRPRFYSSSRIMSGCNCNLYFCRGSLCPLHTFYDVDSY